MNIDALFWKFVSGECPLPPCASSLGWEFIDYDDRKRQVCVAFKESTQLLNPFGIIQGGMLSAMLDACMAPTVFMHLQSHQSARPTKLYVDLVEPALPGRIVGHGQLIRRAGEDWFTKGTLFDDQGRVIASARARYRSEEQA